ATSNSFNVVAAPLQDAVAQWPLPIEPNKNGGPKAGGSSMTPTEFQMVAAIRAYRISIGKSGLFGGPNAGVIGVAQWHANDMATNNYVGLVGSDGEDYLQRLANSDPNFILDGGVIAVRQS